MQPQENVQPLTTIIQQSRQHVRKFDGKYYQLNIIRYYHAAENYNDELLCAHYLLRYVLT